MFILIMIVYGLNWGDCNKMVVIQKDPSGKTYAYQILNESGEEVLYGDGENSIDEIILYFRELRDNIKSFDIREV